MKGTAFLLAVLAVVFVPFCSYSCALMLARLLINSTFRYHDSDSTMSNSIIPTIRLPQTTVVHLGDLHYYVRNRIEVTQSLHRSPYGTSDNFQASTPVTFPSQDPSAVVPTTVIHSNSDSVTLKQITDTLTRFLDEDDVFHGAFMHGGYLFIYLNHLKNAADAGYSSEPAQDVLNTVSGRGSSIPDDLSDFLKERSLHLVLATGSPVLPEGPYFTRGRGIHEAWRLFPDDLAAFTTPVVPSDEGGSSL